MNIKMLSVAAIFLMALAMPAIACDEDDDDCDDMDQVQSQYAAEDNYNNAAAAAEQAGNYALADQMRQLADQARRNAESMQSLNPNGYVGAPSYNAPTQAAPR